jgi:hypothetical protein
MALVGPHPSDLAGGLLMIPWGLSFIPSWWLFAWWVRRRLSAARLLFREGNFFRATITHLEHLSLRGLHFTHARVTFFTPEGESWIAFSVNGHPPALMKGVEMPVLYVRGCRYRCVFPFEGKLLVART